MMLYNFFVTIDEFSAIISFFRHLCRFLVRTKPIPLPSGGTISVSSTSLPLRIPPLPSPLRGGLAFTPNIGFHCEPP